jgi:beta-glucosidase
MHLHRRAWVATFAQGVLFAMGSACGHPTTAGSLSPGGGTSSSSNTGGSGNSGSTDQPGTGGAWAAAPDGRCQDTTYRDRYTPGYTEARDPRVDQLLMTMTVAQKALQMQGTDPGTEDSKNYSDIQRSPDDTVTRIRGYKYRDAGRGLNLDARQQDRTTDGKDYATVMPTASARGASFDLDLEYRIGEALGDETVASKNTMLLAPCMNILRHPYWGRSQETYGEDVFHLGRMASALTAGIQQHVAACAKHYAGNNIEDGRANQDAKMDEQTLHEVYARHFEMVVQDGGVACVMAAYNSVNGTKCTQNEHLLTDILRDEMGFRGVVLTDWWAMPGGQAFPSIAQAKSDAADAIHAGLNIEVPWTLHFGQLEALVTENAITMAELDTSVGYILEQKLRFNSLDLDGSIGKQPTTKTSLSGSSIAGNADHIELSREAALKSMVLVKNAESTLPIKPEVQRIAVIGKDVAWQIQSSTPRGEQLMKFSTDQPLGDRGSSRVNADPATTTGPFAGISEVGTRHGATAVSANGVTDEVRSSDLIVVMVGYTPGDEGEEYAIMTGGDRSTLTLPHDQDALVEEAAATGKPTVVVIQSGGVINMPWLDRVQAVVWSSYSGQRGGLALAELMFGEANFSGKMPVAWPKEEDLPPFRDEPTNTTMGYFIGYRALDAQGKMPLFPYGHGLSYSHFSYSNLALPCSKASKNAVVEVKVEVTNDSPVDGEETAFLFVAYPNTKASRRSVKELKGFTKTPIAAGTTTQVIIPLRVADLKYWNGGTEGHWEVESGDVTILVGPDADHLQQTGTLSIE